MRIFYCHLSGFRSSLDGMFPKSDTVGEKQLEQEGLLITALAKVVSVEAICEVVFG